MRKIIFNFIAILCLLYVLYINILQLIFFGNADIMHNIITNRKILDIIFIVIEIIGVCIISPDIINNLENKKNNKRQENALKIKTKGYRRMNFKTYNELMQYIDNNFDKVEYILNYDIPFGFAVVKINDEYWYFEQGENDCDTFCKVQIIAQLTYDSEHDLLVKDGQTLHTLFDCYCCGEYVNDNSIQYLWFEAVA